MKRANSKPAPAPTSVCPPATPPKARRLRRGDLPVGTQALAQALIGTLLVRSLDGELLIGRIVETEAYQPGDPASHAYRGQTRRNRAMFAEHLVAYVYFIYGTNWCLNVSSEGAGIGAAVLIRACEPVAGHRRMRALRGRPELRDHELLRGPGNLCRGLAIGPDFDGADLQRERRLWLAGDGVTLPVRSSTRIGISRAAEHELRYYAVGNRSVSGPRALSP